MFSGELALTYELLVTESNTFLGLLQLFKQLGSVTLFSVE